MIFIGDSHCSSHNIRAICNFVWNGIWNGGLVNPFSGDGIMIGIIAKIRVGSELGVKSNFIGIFTGLPIPIYTNFTVICVSFYARARCVCVVKQLTTV